ncbi:hypothetical protein EXE41_06405 [Halorubrum sp. SD690R]|uniref:hypothetical protein n=1 Tax=Halorubrum sp. SD690R TaxID=2518117 RepID=UPI0010F4DE15|nr:hypothetical protein [Halorubrum sp. SD690R]TKX47250.1 hypothetical protein EXE41_06405 [Halorubrum sp. SD690R]
MNRTLLIGLLIGCLVAGGAVSAADRAVTVDDAMEIPGRTVTVGGESYQVSSLARVPRGESLRARTSGVDETGYRVYLHDARGTVVDQGYVAPSGDGTVVFDTSTYEAGSYVLSLYHDGTYADPLPVVVPAYDVSVDTPAPGLDGDDTDTVSVELAEREPGHAVRGVTLVVSNATATWRYPASRVDGEYVVGLNETGLAAGTYSVYAVVTNGNDAPGPTDEVIGISDSSQFDVERGSSGTEEGESSGIDDETRTENATPSTNATPTDESEPTVISPDLSANKTAGETVTDDEAGGTPLALLSLAAIIGFLAVRGPDERE